MDDRGDRRVPPTAAVLAELQRLDETVAAMTVEAQMLRYELAEERGRVTAVTNAIRALVVALALVVAIGVGMLALIWGNRQAIRSSERTYDYLVQCTTPGPRTPTPADPRTGHACWDQLVGRRSVPPPALPPP